MFIEIEHRLSFTCGAFIRGSFLELRMQPATTLEKTLHSFVLAVGPPRSIEASED